jgi:hexosaminidase
VIINVIKEIAQKNISINKENNMRNICFILIALLLSMNVLANNNLRYGIIPRPAQLVELSGSFTLNKKTVVAVDLDNALFKEIADDFILQFKIVSGHDLKITDTSLLPTSNFIELKTTEGLADEAYQLIISPDKIIIKASKANGAFYALQTIYQLLPPEIYGKQIAKRVKWEVPCCEIQDAPHFSYRGLMLDVGRHFMPKDFILKLIDVMSMHKQNMFHWHLTEDQGWRIEIKKYPRLTEIGSFRKESEIGKTGKGDGTPHGGFYTQEEVKEIVEYARKRYVTIIPEIELPGHATAAIASYPHLACIEDTTYEVSTTWGIKKDVFCPKATTFQFFEDVFTELFDLFPSPYYHIGGDECPRDRWKACEHCQDLMRILGLKNEDELQIFFVARMEKFLREQGGKKVIGWDEIIDGGAVPNTVVMAYRGHARAIRAARQNQYTILTPNRWCYLDYYQEDPDTEELCMFLFLPLEKVYNYYPIPDTLEHSQHKYFLGHQGSLWTEYISNTNRAEYMMFPRAIAMSEVGWCSKEQKNWDSFRHKMLKEFSRLDYKEINYSKAFYNVIFNYDRKEPFPKKVALTIDYPEADIYYTLNGKEPTMKSILYTDSILVNEGDVIKTVGFLKNGKTVGKRLEKKFEIKNDVKH